MKRLSPVAGFLLSAAFLTAGISKVDHPHKLMESILAYHLVPVEVAWVSAFFLPWVEIVAALALWIPALRDAARLLLGGMLVVFLVALISAWARGLGIDCGCWHGVGFTLTVPQAVAVDMGLLILWAMDGFLRRPQKN